MSMSSKRVKLGIFINPIAGRVRDAGSLRERIAKYLRGKAECRFHLPDDPEQMQDAARRMLSEGADGIVVAGGDGSLHRILPALAGGSVPLGVLPMGSVNLLALEWGIPADPERALDIVLSGKTRRIDLATANGVYFFHVLGAGFDANIMKVIRSRWQKKLRWLVMPGAGLIALAKTPPARWEIVCDGALQPLDACGRGVIVANGGTYGGAYRLHPDVRSDDGLLDVFFIRAKPFKELMMFCLGALTGGVLRASLPHARARHVQIRASIPMPVQMDGEVYLETPVELRIKPKELSIFVP